MGLSGAEQQDKINKVRVAATNYHRALIQYDEHVNT